MTQAAPWQPDIRPASESWRAAAAGHRPAPGLRVELWAAEPLLANPVAIWPARDGSVYVVESFRCHAGVTDIREHMHWLDDDLACQTVADRVDMYARHLGEGGLADFARAADRVSVLRDTDGDGRADRATVFADIFRNAEDGVAAGVLEHEGTVYATVIPKLWALRDLDGDDVADEHVPLSDGWGVRVAFLGHDLHGLRLGPDGRLWFSIGDRGFSVLTREGQRLHHPDTGAVLRCEPDGSDLRVIHIGLRNPQELAFDDWGELFTADNNSDAGDRARLVAILPDGDSGWRQPYQWLTDRGPWEREALWRADAADPPAWLVPPLANLARGPSGFTHVPGPTLLGPRFADSFLLCDFTGQAESSEVLVFTLSPHGAGFELQRAPPLVTGILATDVEIGPDGAAWLSDWVAGWRGTGEGRLWRVLAAETPEAQQDEAARGWRRRVAQTQRLLAEGTAQLGIPALEAQLGHFDRRVRQAAHLALAVRGVPGQMALLQAVRGSGVSRRAALEHGHGPPAPSAGSARLDPPGSAARLALLARLHGLWGLLVAARSQPALLSELEFLARDAEPEVRAQLLAWLPEQPERWTPGVRAWVVQAVLENLAHDEPRVRRRAAQAAGTLAVLFTTRRAEVEARLRARLAAGDDRDPVLRNQYARAWGALLEPGDVRWPEPGSDAQSALLDVLGLRARLAAAGSSPRDHRADADAASALAAGLATRDIALLSELARVIYDVPAAAPALPALAERLDTLPAAAPAELVRRALGAAEGVGRERDARALRDAALRSDWPVSLRELALQCLQDWAAPPPRERLTGFWRGAESRPAPFLAELAASLSQKLLASPEAALHRAWVQLAAATQDARFAPLFTELLWQDERASSTRRAALEALAHRPPPDWPDVLARVLADDDGRLRAAALAELAECDPQAVLPLLEPLLERGELAERRTALQLLARSDAGDARADAWLDEQARQAAAQQLPHEVLLELAVALEARGLQPWHVSRPEPLPAPAVGAVDADSAAESHEEQQRRRARLLSLEDTLFGGDAVAGAKVFARPELSCQRCHAGGATGAPQVGPELHDVGLRRGRRELLESLLSPNAHIVRGWSVTRLVLRDGSVLAGRLLHDGPETCELLDAEGQVHSVPADSIVQRLPGLSAMPDGLVDGLDRRELRDLIEYLAGLREVRD